MNANYDVVILGCGEAGIFAAYELTHLAPGLKILHRSGQRYLPPELSHRGR